MKQAKRELRRVRLTDVELRDASEGVQFSGYAATFNQPYDMCWWTESIRAGAFTRTLNARPDVRLLINHDGLPLARTRSNTLTLDQDDVGLRVSATLDSDDPDVQSIVPKMRRGDLDEMSFAFRTIEDAWTYGTNGDPDTRELVELALDGGDVSLVTYPANPTTSASIRSQQIMAKLGGSRSRMAAAFAEIRDGKVLSNQNNDLVSAAWGALEAILAAADPDFDHDAVLADAHERLAGGGTTVPAGTTPDSSSDDEEESEGRMTPAAARTALLLHQSRLVRAH